MSLTTHQIELIQSSFAKVEPIADTAAEIFYAKLFEFDPYLKPLFKGDMKEQGRKLMSMLKVATGSLNDLNAVVPVLNTLADRHVDYGVRPQDYTTVGNALLFTLGKGLGDDFTDETRDAWVDMYKVVASTMKAEHDKKVGVA